ncbi:hypothetical protein DRN86_04105, partial [Candidatus Geothermarchaeota archaeon]
TVPGFIGGFGGTALHLLGDLFTYVPFKPLWPLSNKEISLRLFRADNRLINVLFLGAGFIAFVLYLLLKFARISISLY